MPVKKGNQPRRIGHRISKVGFPMLCCRKVPERSWLSCCLVQLHRVSRVNDCIIQSMNQENGTRGNPCDIAPGFDLMKMIACTPGQKSIGNSVKHAHCEHTGVGRKMERPAYSQFNSAPLGGKSAISDHHEGLRCLR